MTAFDPLNADCWVFDLDNTLYPASCDLFSQIDLRMKGFIADFLGLPPEEAFIIQKKYFRDYGTTLKGLMTLHGMEPSPFLDHVHDIALDPIVKNDALDRALSALPGRKVIFTNASKHHAERVAKKIGIHHHFDGIFDIIDAGYTPKPEPDIYHQMCKALKVDAAKAVMVEDMARNLIPAKAMGMTTLWVRTGSDFGHEGSDGDHIHHDTDDLTQWLTDLIAGDIGGSPVDSSDPLAHTTDQKTC